MHRYGPLVLLGMLLMGCASDMLVAPPSSVPLLHPSQLLTSPDGYDGTLVTVEGYVDVGIERRFLLEKPSVADSIKGNPCITLISAGRIMSDVEKFNGKRVRLTGKFIKDYSKLGIVHMGSCGFPALDLDNSYELRVLD